MMKLFVALIVMAMGLGAAGGAQAYFQNGNKLLIACENKQSAFDSGGCMMYVVGVADAMTGTTISGWTACIPMAVTRGQIRDIAIAFLVKNPALRHFTSSSLVAQALHEAFPCQ